MRIENIYPVIITRDAEATIEKTLDSLKVFREVVVYDNGSTDETLNLCHRFPNTRVIRGEFLGFGPTKHHAAGLTYGDWILSIDADEYLSKELLSTLRSLDLSDVHIAYAFDRHNLVMAKDVKRGGFGNDWLIRLYHREICLFNDSVVHEKVIVPDEVTIVRLKGPMWHQAVTNIDQFLQKISLYSELELQRGVGAKIHSPAIIVIRASWSFFRSYVLKLGLLEGWRGLLIATAYAQGTFFKHMKRYVDKAVRE